MLLETLSNPLGEKCILRKFCLIIIPLALVSIHIQAQNGWTKKADMLTPRVGASASVVNNKIYVIGGMSSYLVDTDANEVYDPSTNTWETKQPMPTKRSFLLTCVVNDTIYAIGGGYPTSTKKVEAYDPATNTWTTKQDMLYPWTGVYGVTVNEKIYTMGGNYERRNCFEYDPRSNEWKEKTSIPVGRCAGPLSATVYGGLVYTFGGTTKYPFYGTTDPKEPLSTVDVYNPQMDTWDTTKMDMPTPRYALSTFLVDDTIYAIGGTQSRGTALSTVEVYDPFTDTWGSKPNMPFEAGWISGTVLNNKVYVFGKKGADWVTGDGSVWEYDPAFHAERGLAYALYARFSRHGWDTVGITARVKNPLAHVLKVVAVLTSGTQALIDSMFLADDGLHGDSTAADGLWGCQYVPKKDDTIRVTLRTDDLTAGTSRTLPNAATLLFTRRALISVDTRMVELGPISMSTSRYDTTFLVRNIGYAADSLTVSLDPVTVVPDTAVSAFPKLFTLAPSDSQRVTFHIRPNLLPPQYYVAQVIVEPKSAFGPVRFEKNFQFQVTVTVQSLIWPRFQQSMCLTRTTPTPSILRRRSATGSL